MDPSTIFSEEYIVKHYSYRNKYQLLSEILNTFCSGTYVSKNLWMLEHIVEMLENIEESAHKTQDIINLICNMCQCISRNKKKTLEIPCQESKHILYSFPKYSTPFSNIKHLLTEDTYSYMVIIYENMKESRDAVLNLSIVKNILYDDKASKTPRTLDPYDCMFLFLLEVIELLPIEENIKKYVLHSKDIFYYRLKKRDKPLRSSLIYYSVYTLTTRHVSYKPVSSHGHEYLFVEPRLDQKRNYEVERSRRLIKDNHLYKSIEISTHNEPPSIQIKKSQD